MSDQPSDLPELTPEQESAVRRLLAEARHDEPIPTDVADRLDTVLAGLTRDEPGAPGVAPVIDLAARRRRRNAAAVLAGAAAVIVAGFGIGQVIDVGGSDDDAASSTNADSSGGRAEAKDNSGSDESPADGSAATISPQGAAPEATRQVLKLSSQHLARDVDDQLDNDAVQLDARNPVAAFSAVGCTTPPPPNKFGTGDFYPALFDGIPAVLALRPPAEGQQQADVLACDTAASLASVSITPR
jgi:hypothetical protein